MLKKAASGVLALLPCSRTMSTLRSTKWLRPCWIDPSERLRACFFEHSLPLTMRGSPGAFIGCWSEIFNRPSLQVRHHPTLHPQESAVQTLAVVNSNVNSRVAIYGSQGEGRFTEFSDFNDPFVLAQREQLSCPQGFIFRAAHFSNVVKPSGHSFLASAILFSAFGPK